MPGDPRMQSFDPLSHALGALNVRAKLVARVEASGVWGIDLPDASPSFHAVLAGEAWVRLTKGKAIPLVAGDLLFVTVGKRHQILSHPKATAEPLDRLVARGWQPDRGVLKLGSAKEPETVLVCGNFIESHHAVDTLLGGIPPTLVLKKSDFTSFDALGATLGLLELEAVPAKPGAAIVCARLVELLLAYGLRQWLASPGPQGDSWLRGLMDPSISRALTLMHGNLGAEWTVERLAKEVTMSRSAFAARFVELVGEPPARHLLRWRMQVAKDLLVDGRRISEVARRLGYESESSFSRAFTRVMGRPPMSYRPKRSNVNGAEG